MFVLFGVAFLVKPVEGSCSGVSPNLTAPTWADVAACHRTASNGDTIAVSGGSYTVTTTTSITKYVNIVASGTVTLTDNTPNTSDLIVIAESTLGSTRLQGFTFVQGNAVHGNPNGVIRLTTTTRGLPILIAGNSYKTLMSSGDFIIAQVNRGVIWNNLMTGFPSSSNCFDNNSFVRHKLTGVTSSWTTPSTFGSEDSNGNLNLYIETNTLVNVAEGIDTDDNARTVVRYNTITNSGMILHGVDTSGTQGARYVEYYNNTFIRDMSLVCQGGTLPVNQNGFIGVRGGTALIHDNVIPDINDGYWGNKSEITFAVEELRRNAGGYPCWNTTTQRGAGYPAPKQSGWGYITGSVQPGRTGVRQDLEPIYLWNNTGGGNYNSPVLAEYGPNECGTSADTVANYIQQNREYYLSTPKPGYKPYTYPHPLTASTQSSTSGAPAIK
jgi:hypothetical protein